MKKIIIIIFTIFSIIYLLNITNNHFLADEDNLPTCYQQSDPRWGSHMNGDGSIASSACGLLSLTNAVNYLTGNFINPIELADYAYSIDAYNRPIPGGGGTWRDLFYHRLGDFEEKYGFKVVNSSIWRDVTDTRLRNHLMDGGVSIAHVYGHFIALVEYDQDTNSYMVYDSAASSRRHTLPKGTWLTEQQLSEDLMDIDWFCLISKSSIRNTSLDGVKNKDNGRAEVEITKSINDPSNLLISGSCYLKDPVIKYYYNVCTSYSYESNLFDTLYPLNFDNRKDLNTLPGNEYFTDNAYCGFKGIIDLNEIYQLNGRGTKYIYVFAETNNGEKVNIAEIKLNLTTDEFNNTSTIIDDENRKITVSSELNENSLVIGNLDLRETDFCIINSNSFKEGHYLIIGNGIDEALLGHQYLTDLEANSINQLIIKLENNYAGKVSVKYLGADSPIIDSIVFSKDDNFKLYNSLNNDHHQVLIGKSNDINVFREEDHHLNIISKEATCLEDGFFDSTCIECNLNTKHEIKNKTGHTASDYYYNDESHYLVCETCCEEYEFEAHDLEITINSKKHGYICKKCGWSGNFDNHDYDEEGICRICNFKNPNHKTNDDKPTQNEEEPINNEIIEDIPKKSCKKNMGILVINLFALTSLAYIFIKKK